MKIGLRDQRRCVSIGGVRVDFVLIFVLLKPGPWRVGKAWQRPAKCLLALAGSAAAVAGLMQQLTGATGGYLVGLVPHEGAVNLGWVMLGFALLAAAAQFFLHRR